MLQKVRRVLFKREEGIKFFLLNQTKISKITFFKNSDIHIYFNARRDSLKILKKSKIFAVKYFHCISNKNPRYRIRRKEKGIKIYFILNSFHSREIIRMQNLSEIETSAQKPTCKPQKCIHANRLNIATT